MKQAPEELVIPKFKSDIPSMLTEGLTDKDKHILDALSEIKQATNWQSPVLASLYKQAKITNGRVNEGEDNIVKIVSEIDILKLKIDAIEKKTGQLDKLIKLIDTISSRPFLFSMACMGFFFFFIAYPFFLTVEFNQLIPMLKMFFG